MHEIIYESILLFKNIYENIRHRVKEKSYQQKIIKIAINEFIEFINGFISGNEFWVFKQN